MKYMKYMKYMNLKYIEIYRNILPGTCLSFVLGVQPSKRRPKLQSKQGSSTGSRYIYIYTTHPIVGTCFPGSENFMAYHKLRISSTERKLSKEQGSTESTGHCSCHSLCVFLMGTMQVVCKKKLPLVKLG